MIFLENNKNNLFACTLLENRLSAGTNYLFYFKSNATYNDLYCIMSATTQTDRSDIFNLLITGTSSNNVYINNELPILDDGFFDYKVYELTQLTGITINELSSSTISVATACTSTNILEYGKIKVDRSSDSSLITYENDTDDLNQSNKFKQSNGFI